MMTTRYLLITPKALLLTALLMVLSIAPWGAVYAASMNDNLQVTQQTQQAGASSQKKIETLSRETQHLLNEYKKILHNAEYQSAYSEQLAQLKREQENQLESLEQQLNNIKITQQRIMPLMTGMTETLQDFILLDLPFHQEQRLASVLALKQQLKSASLSTPAKFRSVWEAYQIETDYGRSIESWRGPVTIDSEEYSVEFLRIGRIALFYQSLDGDKNAYWDAATRQWQPLESDTAKQLKQGIRVASNQLAPQLLTLPLVPTALAGSETRQALSEGQ